MTTNQCTCAKCQPTNRSNMYMYKRRPTITGRPTFEEVLFKAMLKQKHKM